MVNFLKNSIHFILLITLLLMIIDNISSFSSNMSNIILLTVSILAVGLVLFLLYRKKIINTKFINIIIWILFIFGILIRIFLIFKVNLQLESDFELYYTNALGIINGNLPSQEYLAYNGYAYNFAFILSIIIRIFGDSIKVIFTFNMILQIITVFILYKIIKDKTNSVIGKLGGAVWFLLPTVVFANFLVSTETLFMLLFILCFWVIFKIFNSIEETPINKTLYLYCILFGILISITNGIRPIMIIFIIALIVYFILKYRKIKQLLLLILILASYFITNIGMTAFEENGIGMPLRPGAQGWAIYFGSNYDSGGAWTEEDSIYMNEVLKNSDNADKRLINDAINRYKQMGVRNSLSLFEQKFYKLWTENSSSFYFVDSLLSEQAGIKLISYENTIITTGNVMTLLILIAVFINIIYDIKKKKDNNLLVELFIIGYVLSNLIIVLNGRYNFPIYPLLIVLAMQIFNAQFFKGKRRPEKDVERKKIVNPKVLLIIPAYNEALNIQSTCEDILKHDEKLNFIVIDDGSTDETSQICKINKYPYISLVNNLGIGGAVQTGYKYANYNGYDIAVQFDGDGQHNAEYIDSLINPIINGQADFVVGSRFINNISEFRSTKSRRIGINIIAFLINLLSNVNITDPTSGFRAANKEVIELFARDYPTEYPEPESILMLLKKDYIVKEIPVKMNERRNGVSSIKSWKSVYYMINVCLSLIIANIRRGK